MKRFLINFSLIITALIIYFLQENFFNWFTIAGVMPNLFVILVLFIGLFTNKNKGTIYGLIIGMFLDFFVGSKLGIYTITLGLVGLVAGIFDKNFSKDSRMTIMLMVAGITASYEIIIFFKLLYFKWKFRDIRILKNIINRDYLQYYNNNYNISVNKKIWLLYRT